MSIVNVIIETPKGSSQKYDFDKQTGYIKLNKLMPAGLVFPYDFGFIEGTIGEDGDPLDIIVISEVKTFSGCAMDCRIIGAIKARQRERDGKVIRNDRYLGVPVVSAQYQHVNNLSDLPVGMLDQLTVFFETYNAQAGKKFTVQDRLSSKEAYQMIKKATIKDGIATQLIQVFLPLYQKNGKPFPQKYFTTVKKQLTDQFKGLSIYSNAPADGYWENESDSLEKDQVLVYEVMATAVDVEFWQKYKATLEKQFKQDTIVVRCLHMNLI